MLARLTEEGHCAFPRTDLTRKAVEMLDIPDPIVSAAIDHALEEKRLVSRPELSDGNMIFLASLDTSEEMLSRNLLALARGRHPCPPINVPKAIDWVEQKTGLTLADSQRAALTTALASKVLVITGGPGVGKTTLVNAIVRILAAKRLNVVLAAPTGRAAKRMSETSGREAKTIHRLLEFDPKNGGFKRDRENPLEGDVFVVDEMSMVDVALAHQLARAIPPRAAVLFVGDVDQLPSVGPGAVRHHRIRGRRRLPFD